MGAVPTLLRNAVDTYVHSANAPRNYDSGVMSNRLFATTGPAPTGTCEAFVFFGLPFTRGVQIISAKLRLYQQTATSGSKTVSVARVAAKWTASKVVWSTRPGVTGSSVSLSQSSTPVGTVWEWDVTALLQTVSNGATWYGFRLASASSGAPVFHSSSSALVGFRPVLEISWKDNPLAPTVLHPSDDRIVSLAKPTLQCDFTDLSGDISMAAINVRIFSSQANAAANSSPEWDSGTIATDVPELDLATTSYPGVPANATRWWRVRVQDGAGLWSGWSDYESFAVFSKGTLTLNNPAASPNNFVSESTPPIDWTFTGRTQKAFEVIVVRVNGAIVSRPISSGKIAGVSTVYTLPDRVLIDSASTYRLTLRIWDTLDREASPGDPPYVEVTREFTFQYDATVNPVGSISATLNPAYPWVQLDFSRATQPDRWDIYRDGRVIYSAPGSELFVSGTSYRFTDRKAPPRQDCVWMAVAVVNGKGSASNPTVTKQIKPRTVSLSDTEGTDVVLIWNPSYDPKLVESSSVFSPAGTGPPILITQGEYGYQGHVEGILAETPLTVVTAAGWRDRFKRLKKNNGQTLLLTIVDMAMECFIKDANIVPMVDGEGVKYAVSFDFYQTDWEE